MSKCQFPRGLGILPDRGCSGKMPNPREFELDTRSIFLSGLTQNFGQTPLKGVKQGFAPLDHRFVCLDHCFSALDHCFIPLDHRF